MRMPLFLFAMSCALGMVACVPGSPLGVGTFHAAILAATAAFVLVLWASFQDEPVARKGKGKAGKCQVVVDGSNVMYWVGGKPNLDTVKTVVRDLKQQGLAPVVWFDANAGYLTKDRYLGPAPLARHIGLPAKHVFVAPRGTPADPLILRSARSLKARVVTNDRFRDWADMHPYLNAPGFLVRGQVARGEVQLVLN